MITLLKLGDDCGHATNTTKCAVVSGLSTRLWLISCGDMVKAQSWWCHQATWYPLPCLKKEIWRRPVSPPPVTSASSVLDASSLVSLAVQTLSPSTHLSQN